MRHEQLELFAIVATKRRPRREDRPPPVNDESWIESVNPPKDPRDDDIPF